MSEQNHGYLVLNYIEDACAESHGVHTPIWQDGYYSTASGAAGVAKFMQNNKLFENEKVAIVKVVVKDQEIDSFMQEHDWDPDDSRHSRSIKEASSFILGIVGEIIRRLPPRSRPNAEQ